MWVTQPDNSFIFAQSSRRAAYRGYGDDSFGNACSHICLGGSVSCRPAVVLQSKLRNTLLMKEPYNIPFTSRIRQKRIWNQIMRTAYGRRHGSQISNPLDEVAQGVLSIFNRKSQRKSAVIPLAQMLVASVYLPTAVMTTLAKPAVDLIAGILRGSAEDVKAVLDIAELALVESGRFGKSVKFEQVVAEPYSSMAAKGVSHRGVALRFKVRTQGRDEPASCNVVIGPDGVPELQNLRVGKVKVAHTRVRTAHSDGKVIDVTR